MSKILNTALIKIRNLILNVYIFFNNSKKDNQEVCDDILYEDDVLYAYGFPPESESVLGKLYLEKKITLISSVPSDNTVIKNIVFYKESEKNPIFETEYDVEKIFKIGKKGKDFHRSLYILMTIDKYSIDDNYICLFRNNKIGKITSLVNNLLNQHITNHNLFNIRGILLQQQNNVFDLIDNYITAQKNVDRKKISLLVKLIEEYVVDNPHILVDSEVRSELYDIYQKNNLKRVPCYFIGFPKSLHETIHYIYPFFKVQFLNKTVVGQKNIFYSNKACIDNGVSIFGESIQFFSFGETEKRLHHNLYILSFLKNRGMENELQDFLYDCDNLNKMRFITSQIEKKIGTSNQTNINILCILYARLSEPNNFFIQLSKIEGYQDLSFLASLIEEQLAFTEKDVSIIKDTKLLKILSLRLYKRMYYEKALVLFKALEKLGDEQYQIYHALTLYKLNMFEASEAIFHVLLKENEDDYAYWSYVGMNYMQQFKYEEAIEIYRKVLKLVPFEKNVKGFKQIANYHQIIANAAIRNNQAQLANYHYLVSILYWPSKYEIYAVLYQTNKSVYYMCKSLLTVVNKSIDYAISFYEKKNTKQYKRIFFRKIIRKNIHILNFNIQEIYPSYSSVSLNSYINKIFNGNLPFLYKQKQLTEATLGRIEILEGSFECALKKLQKSIQYSKTTHFIDPYLWLADFYLSIQNYDLAIQNYKEILKYEINNKNGINGIAQCYVEQGNYQLATDFMEKNSHFFNQKNNQEMTRVMNQKLAFGTKDYKKAWSCYKEILLSRSLRVDNNVRYVQNINNIDAGDQVFLVSLWGPGDEIRWASLYNEFQNMFPNLTISCEPRLNTILSRSFPEINFLSVARTIRGKYDYNKGHLYNELPSVGLISAFENESYRFAKTQDKVILVTDILEDMRSDEASFIIDEGYMLVDNSLNEKWANKIKKIGNKPKIGICWKSGLIDINRGIHYTEIEEWLPLFKLDKFTFINLQYAGYEEDIELLKSKYNIDLIHFRDLNLRDDFENTSALMNNLDFIISPCTTMIELAGALGVSSILTSNAPDIVSRIQEDSNQDLWFSSVKHIRATSLGDKKSIVNQVVEYLKNFSS